MNYFIDANIFLRVLVKENEHFFNECTSFLSLVKKGDVSAYTSTAVIAEVVWTLSSFYNFSRKETAKAAKSIVNLKGLKIRDESDVSQAVEMYSNEKVKFIDGLIASDPWFKEGKMVIVSYDTDFDTLEVKRKEPGEF